MSPKARLVVLATLILLGAGFWWVSVIAPPGDTVPDYTVLNRLPAAADVLIPSLSREDDEREQVFRAIATTEGLDPAFFFSTAEAVGRPTKRCCRVRTSFRTCRRGSWDS